MTRLWASLGIVLALSISGCGRIGLTDPLAPRAAQTTYEPLPAAPTTPVTASALPPPPPTTAPPGTPAASLDPNAPPPVAPPPGTEPPAKTQVAAVNEKAAPIDRGSFNGAWKISSGSDTCQLFVSLTSWSGGYRATTRGCNTDELKRITSWDLSGKSQVALKAGDGAVIALVSSSGPERFNGSTTSKQSILLSR